MQSPSPPKKTSSWSRRTERRNRWRGPHWGGGGRTQMRTGEARPVAWLEKFFYKQKRWQKSGIHRLLFLPGFVWLLSFWPSSLLVSPSIILRTLRTGIVEVGADFTDAYESTPI